MTGTTRLQSGAWVTALRAEPRPDGPMDTQILFGETVAPLGRQGDWLRVRADLDGYEGWALEEAFCVPVLAPTHRVAALRTYVFSEPDFKSAPAALLSLNAKLTLGERRGRYVHVVRLNGWVVGEHVRAVDAFAGDPARVAEGFLGAPYLWGGKESLGCDCSGLVQAAFEACGVFCPRDSGDQEAHFTHVVDRGAARRGDLVFWPGHVGVMVDAARMVHANATAMATTVDDVDDFAARVAGPVHSVRRPGP